MLGDLFDILFRAETKTSFTRSEPKTYPALSVISDLDGRRSDSVSNYAQVPNTLSGSVLEFEPG